jgi:mitochondrial enoyl-[acyl-carrier protein] reductase / trans-2-enoyl-CoA reductase
MKALVQTGYGDPENVLELQDLADEVPDPGEVVIEMEAAVVHVADLLTVSGRGSFRKAIPRTPGYEGVGRVLAIGSEVTNVAVGDRVLAPIGSGTHREQLRVAAQALIPAPEGDAPQIALLAVNPTAALLMLQSFVKLQEGDWLIQNAANSTVGRVILQLAPEQQLRVISVVKSAEVAAELKDEGATVILIDDDQLVQRVSMATQGVPIRLGLDAVGGDATARIARCLGDGGIVINYGAMSGKPCEVPYEVMAARDVRLVGFNTNRQLARCSQEERTALYERLGELVSSGRLRARVAGVYPISRAIEAYQHAGRVGDKRFGKVVIRIKDDTPRPGANSPSGQPGS